MLKIKRFLSYLPVALIAIVAMSPVSHAALLGYEGFDYTAGDNLAGLNGGVGWDGGWSNNNNYTVVADAMSYDGIPSTGIRITMNDNARYTGIQRGLDVSGTFGAYAETNSDGDQVIGKDNTSIWTSFLLQGATGNTQGNWVSFRDDFIDNFQGTVNVGKTNGFPAPNNPSQIGLWERDGSTLGQNVDTNIDYTGEAQLMLVEFIFGVDGNDLVNLYIDEDALADPNTYIADATLSGFDMGFYSIYLNRADTRGVVYGWDEFRIGETANDVLPNAASAVPEPTTLALISLGLVGIGYRRRKHSKTAT